MPEPEIFFVEASGPDTHKTVHIDTSLQIELQKEQKKSEPVRIALSKFIFKSTSTYARKEFKRAWLKDLGLIYKLCDGCKSIDELYNRIAESTPHPSAQRRRERCLQAMRAFLSRLDHNNVTLAEALIRTRAHLGEAILGAYMKWDRSVTHEYDGTGCIRSAERPARAENGAIDVTVRECKPRKIQCTVHSFFDANRDAFSKISEAILTEASEELKKTRQTITAAMKDSKILCDSKKCAAMSDALIAVDGLRSNIFAANNDKEWVTISGALGKVLLNPVREHKKASAGL